MQAYIVRRLLLFIPSLLGVSIIVFFLIRLAPGDIVDVYAALSAGALATQEETARVAAEIRQLLGLDRPLIEQYGSWMWSILRGELGFSYWQTRPVVEILAQRAPVSLELAAMAMFISVLWAIPLGLVSAFKQDTWLDHVLRVWVISGLSLPIFWLGVMVLFVLSLYFHWIPSMEVIYFWENPAQNLTQFIWPAIVLAFSSGAPMARLVRSEAIEVIREDYIRTARAKGLAERVVISRHVLRNALLPVITWIGLSVGRLISGAVITESVFNLPGLGTLLLASIAQRDYEVVGSVILISALIFLVLNLLVDVLYTWVDPRVRLA